MKRIFIGTIPGIFGYGMSVLGHTKKECKEALKAKYKEWKKQYPDDDTTFSKSYEDWGGYIRPIDVGKVYYDDFAE